MAPHMGTDHGVYITLNKVMGKLSSWVRGFFLSVPSTSTHVMSISKRILYHKKTNSAKGLGTLPQKGY